MDSTYKVTEYYEILTVKRGDPAKFWLRSPHLTRSSLVELKVLLPEYG